MTDKLIRVKTSGSPEWKAGTFYGTNELCVHNEIAFLCLAPHTSGSTFEPANWAELGTNAIGAGTITTAKIAAGLALVETGNAPQVAVERVILQEYEPSASRITLVTVTGEIITKHNGMEMTVTVGGIARRTLQITIAPTGTEPNQVMPGTTLSDTFMCNPGEKWKAAFPEGEVGQGKLYSQYQVL